MGHLPFSKKMYLPLVGLKFSMKKIYLDLYILKVILGQGLVSMGALADCPRQSNHPLLGNGAFRLDPHPN